MISVLGKACVYNDCKLMYKQNVCFDLGNIYSERYVNGTYKVVCIFFLMFEPFLCSSFSFCFIIVLEFVYDLSIGSNFFMRIHLILLDPIGSF